MIEVISDSRCIDCNLCVKVCPTNVFDAVEGDHPVIARQDDCQTCFLCEIYCPTDALYVAPCAEGPTGIGEATSRGHVAQVLRTLGVRDRLQAVVLAYESGFVRPGRP